MILPVDVTVNQHLIPQLLDRPARIGQHLVKRAEGLWRSFDLAFVAQMQNTTDQQ